MMIPAEKMKHILSPGVKILQDMFTRHQYEIRVVGGAVRDLLGDKIPTDLDFATTATPTKMKDMFEVEQVRIINFSGERHGTITARIEEENFECTTLQIDKLTDGRPAPGHFICDWELDAGRRDLTINALFLGLDGTVYDYFDGIKHLQNNNMKFVGDPDLRIQENYIRILRYFRFFDRISNDPNRHDPDVIASIKRNYHGLSGISRDSVWMEFKKILTGRHVCEIVSKMAECKVTEQIGLSETFNFENMKKVRDRLADQEFHYCSLLAAGMESEEEAIVFINRVRCSNKEKEILLFTIKNRELFKNIESVKVIQDLLVDMVYKEKKEHQVALLAVTELLKYVGRDDLLPEVKFVPKFPIRGGLLIDKVKRNNVNKEMRRLLEMWKESNYSLSRDELLDKAG